MAALDSALREVKVMSGLNEFLDAAFGPVDQQFVGATGSELRQSLLERVA